MGFHSYSSPYDWSRVAQYKDKARAHAGGMVDLSIGSPADPVPQSVRSALADADNSANAYGYPATAGTPDLRAALHEWFRTCRDVGSRPSAPTSCRPSAPKRLWLSWRRCCIWEKVMWWCNPRRRTPPTR